MRVLTCTCRSAAVRPSRRALAEEGFLHRTSRSPGRTKTVSRRTASRGSINRRTSSMCPQHDRLRQVVGTTESLLACGSSAPPPQAPLRLRPKFVRLADTRTGEPSITHYVLSPAFYGLREGLGMELRTALSGVYTHGYRHQNSKDQQAQNHLREVRRTLPALVPPGMRVLVSGSGQSLPLVPWIALLDPDVTTTAQEGLYIVYIYRFDLSP